MRSKKNNAGSYKRGILIITVISIIGLMGIGYSIWTDSVDIITSVSTAKINPVFCSSRYHLEEVRGTGNLRIDVIDNIQDNKINDNHTLLITGDVTMQGNSGNNGNNPGYKAFLHYCIVNNGTIPIKFFGDNGSTQVKINNSEKTIPIKLKDNTSLEYQLDIPSDNGKFKLTLNQQKAILNVDDFFYSETGNPKLQIEATEPGNYKFEIELPFILWNGSPEEYTSWKKVLTIKGDITVKEPVRQ